jgi:hypothetical protein
MHSFLIAPDFDLEYQMLVNFTFSLIFDLLQYHGNFHAKSQPTHLFLKQRAALEIWQSVEIL